MEPETATAPSVQTPIVLTPGIKETGSSERKRGFLATFGILFSGWLLGNLIVLTVLSCVGIYLVGSTGLVKIPVLSNLLFGKPETVTVLVDDQALESGEKKLSQIDSLQSGQTLDSLDLNESEINALFAKQAKTSSDFPVSNPKLTLGGNEFVFTGNLSQTNAPVTIAGKIVISGLNANVEIVSAKFGQFSLPNFIATNIINSSLSKIGLSLSGSQIPAKSLTIAPGTVELNGVSNPKSSP